MDLNEFGVDLEKSSSFLYEKLLDLHPWDNPWDDSTCKRLVPFYREKLEEHSKLNNINLNEDIDGFDDIIRFSSILDTRQLKLIFMDDLNSLPLIADGKYLSADERLDLLIESKRGRLKRIDDGKYLFFNHED